MEGIHFLDLFQGIATLVASEPKIMIGRILLMLLGFTLIYLGSKGVLEPLLMIPMGLGMAAETGEFASQHPERGDREHEGRKDLMKPEPTHARGLARLHVQRQPLWTNRKTPTLKPLRSHR